MLISFRYCSGREQVRLSRLERQKGNEAMPRTRQDRRQLRLDFDQRAESARKASIPPHANDDEEPLSLALPYAPGFVSRAEIERIPYLEERLARRREALAREHANCNGNADDETETGAGAG